MAGGTFGAPEPVRRERICRRFDGELFARILRAIVFALIDLCRGSLRHEIGGRESVTRKKQRSSVLGVPEGTPPSTCTFPRLAALSVPTARLDVPYSWIWLHAAGDPGESAAWI